MGGNWSIDTKSTQRRGGIKQNLKRSTQNLIGCQRLISIITYSEVWNFPPLTGVMASHRPDEFVWLLISAGSDFQSLNVLFPVWTLLQLVDEAVSGPAGGETPPSHLRFCYFVEDGGSFTFMSFSFPRMTVYWHCLLSALINRGAASWTFPGNSLKKAVWRRFLQVKQSWQVSCSWSDL